MVLAPRKAGRENSANLDWGLHTSIPTRAGRTRGHRVLALSPPLALALSPPLALAAWTAGKAAQLAVPLRHYWAAMTERTRCSATVPRRLVVAAVAVAVVALAPAHRAAPFPPPPPPLSGPTTYR